jgi:hypothetical protein
VPKSNAVDAWFARYENPMKDVVQRMRDIILAADPRIEECIKWQAPTFTFNGNRASFYPKSKQHASLVFHQGAKIPGRHSRLEGSGNISRVLKIGSVAEANAARREIEAVVRAWCDWRADDTKATKKKPARKSAKKIPGPTARTRAIKLRAKN